MVVRVGDCSLLNTMTHPRKTILESKWASRGWTSQESFLSRRRLVFTESQLYFESGSLNFFESITHDMEFLGEINRMGQTLRHMSTSIFSGINIHESTEMVDRYRILAVEYSSRYLTHDSDFCNAFEGMTKHFHDNGVGQFWGIAYQRSKPESEESKYCSPILESFVSSLNLYHDEPSSMSRPLVPS